MRYPIILRNVCIATLLSVVPLSVWAGPYDAAVDSELRSPENKARDSWRHPIGTLHFFGLKPDMTVVEIWPGDGMWYTEILAPVLAEEGTLYTASFGANYQGTFHKYLRGAHGRFVAKLRENPDAYDHVVVTTLNPPHTSEIAPEGSADMVLTFRNLHNWMAWETTEETLQAIHKALKPGGILGVTDHRANPDSEQDPKARSGYVHEDQAIALIESQGFELVAKSEINANPKDTANHPNGVWTLPPVLRAPEGEEEKYKSIGESDRFTLKFKKIALQ